MNLVNLDCDYKVRGGWIVGDHPTHNSKLFCCCCNLCACCDEVKATEHNRVSQSHTCTYYVFIYEIPSSSHFSVSMNHPVCSDIIYMSYITYSSTAVVYSSSRLYRPSVYYYATTTAVLEFQRL